MHFPAANLFSIVGIAAATFCATNVDDLVLLFGFLANRSFHISNVIVGYAFGTLAILALSWVGALLADLTRPQYVGFLGFVPLCLGLKHFYDRFTPHKSLSDLTPVRFSKRSQIATVALADIGHGPDTIVVFSVLLAETRSVAQLAVSFVYIILVFVWCAVGFFLLRHPLLREPIQRYGHRFSPYLLIVVGAYIVLGAIHGLA
jgi:cadmium resistance protein CadD (predicted permease)